jgi:hypothetical protein
MRAMFSYASASPGRRAAERLDPPPILKPASLLAAHIRPLLTSYSRRASEVISSTSGACTERQRCLPADNDLRLPPCARLPCVDDKHFKCTGRFVNDLQLQDFRVSGSQTASSNLNLPIPTSHIKARPQSGHWLQSGIQRSGRPPPALSWKLSNFFPSPPNTAESPMTTICRPAYFFRAAEAG